MKKSVLLPKESRIIKVIGENLKLARLRRKMTAEMLAERANISRSTLWSLESGTSNISITSLLQVLSVLGLEKDLLLIAKDDLLGRKLQDANLTTPKRIKNKSSK